MNAAPSTPVAATGPVLFFDGECGLCNRVVRLMLRLDRRGRLRYAPLQGLRA
jgi:predicted DCC family thiol-disulfide oxidoreductase YuxK